jgi:alpha-N-arabinofuranosidase
MRRRELLAGIAAAPLVHSQPSVSRVEVLLREPIARIAPEIYGHFVEHLGGVVYDGIWVGEGSKIPNRDGIRTDITEALAKTKPAVIRWPGGCFADQYDWRDGVGPRAARPKRTNFWVDTGGWPAGANKMGPQVYDPNHFGSADFARFCRRVGAQPYFAANLRSLPAQDFWHWVEYCNSPNGSSTNAAKRAADGEANPLDVRYWGVGNESWGCGGNFSPEDYAIEFKRYSAWVPNYGKPLSMIGSGPSSGELEWTGRFFAKAATQGGLGKMWGWGLHHYSTNVSGGRTSDWVASKGDALRFTREEHYELLREATMMDRLIESHWAVMGEVDRRHRVKLAVDEWGSWHKPGTEPFAEALIGQQNTMRDAVLAGLTLNIFHRHAEKVAMANIAQLVNCLQSLFLIHEEKFCVTPTYHVFAMYADHQGAEAVRTVVSAPGALEWTRPGGAAMRLEGLNASASVQGKRVTVTMVNPSFDGAREVEVRLAGATVRTVTGTALAGANAQSHNTWAAPRAVEPVALAARVSGDAVTCSVGACSVVKLAIELA